MLNFHLHSSCGVYLSLCVGQDGLNRLKEILSLNWRKEERHQESWKEPVFAVAVPVIYCCVTNPSPLTKQTTVSLEGAQREGIISAQMGWFELLEVPLCVVSGLLPVICPCGPSAQWLQGSWTWWLRSPRVNVLETKVKVAPPIILPWKSLCISSVESNNLSKLDTTEARTNFNQQ